MIFVYCMGILAHITMRILKNVSWQTFMYDVSFSNKQSHGYYGKRKKKKEKNNILNNEIFIYFNHNIYIYFYLIRIIINFIVHILLLWDPYTLESILSKF